MKIHETFPRENGLPLLSSFTNSSRMDVHISATLPSLPHQIPHRPSFPLRTLFSFMLTLRTACRYRHHSPLLGPVPFIPLSHHLFACMCPALLPQENLRVWIIGKYLTIHTAMLVGGFGLATAGVPGFDFLAHFRGLGRLKINPLEECVGIETKRGLRTAWDLFLVMPMTCGIYLSGEYEESFTERVGFSTLGVNGGLIEGTKIFLGWEVCPRGVVIAERSLNRCGNC